MDATHAGDEHRPGPPHHRSHLLEELDFGDTRVTLALGKAGPVGAVMERFYRRLTDRYLVLSRPRGAERGRRTGVTFRLIAQADRPHVRTGDSVVGRRGARLLDLGSISLLR